MNTHLIIEADDFITLYEDRPFQVRMAKDHYRLSLVRLISELIRSGSTRYVDTLKYIYNELYTNQ